jgi:kynurenine formamidase
VVPFTVIDLTHTLSPGVPTWEGCCGFENKVSLDYDECTTEVKFRVQRIEMLAGTGTHIDAPSHSVPGGVTVDKLLLEQLISPCVVIDVSDRSHERYKVSLEDVAAFEQKNGKILSKSFVIMRTGWDRFWDTPEKYRNNLKFPSISEEAALLLLERGITGIGIDTLSPDGPEDGFPVHKAILGAGKYIVENIANSSFLPPVGCYTLCLPIKIEGGTEAPVRLVALQGESSALISHK